MKKMIQKKQPDLSTNVATDAHAIENQALQASKKRRDALRRIGKYSAYAIPALLALNSTPAAASG